MANNENPFEHSLNLSLVVLISHGYIERAHCIREILDQRGCDFFDPKSDRLVDLISIAIRG